MSDEVKKDDASSYLAKLKTWGLYAGAILALSIAGALAQRWLGKPVELPPVPVIVVSQDEDGNKTVTILHTDGKRCKCVTKPGGEGTCGSFLCPANGGQPGQCCPCCRLTPPKKECCK